MTSRRMLITGGAGFIGCNSAAQFQRRGWRVTIYDNLSRPGVRRNCDWLQQEHGVEFVRGDIRDADLLKEVIGTVQPEVVLHLAGQVAVTASVENPQEDFWTNAGGTLNLLEACRLTKERPFVIYSSTNKVYGGLEGAVIQKDATRYRDLASPLGVPEERPLDFHSPYGCSKGSADQYVRDYFRIYGLHTVVLRQSCIYGPRQFGIEDQGWVAWFTIAALLGRPIRIYGDGLQVRDVLHVDDLVAVYQRCIDSRDSVAGDVFNIGGGPRFSLSLAELIQLLEQRMGRKLTVSYGEQRPGDQKIYISDIGRALAKLSWVPTIAPAVGVDRLISWVDANRHLFEAADTVFPPR